METKYTNYKVVRVLIRTTKRTIISEILATSEEQAKKIIADKSLNEMSSICRNSDREAFMDDILLDVSEKVTITAQK